MARYLTYPGGATDVSTAAIEDVTAVAATATGSSPQALVVGAVSHADVKDSFLRLCFNSST